MKSIYAGTGRQPRQACIERNEQTYGLNIIFADGGDAGYTITASGPREVRQLAHAIADDEKRVCASISYWEVA